MTNEEKINLIGQKILVLSNDLDRYSKELAVLKKQLELLQQQGKPVVNEPVVIKEPVKETPVEQPVVQPVEEPQPQKITYTIPTPQPKPEKPKVDMEEYIGGNLISKIGIAVLVIGIAWGVKYAIDENLINPLTRIVLGYIAGILILLTALRLKKNYNGFSAILLSGAMASLYFTTFVAYSLYSLFPQTAAFALMVVFTAFTVFAATVYNRQEIGVFGLVGAYAVPFLLSDGSGRVEILLGYMSIINIGVLVLSFKKNWNILNHVAYALSWLIFGIWFLDQYDREKHQTIALVFSFLFFITFYISLMAYKTVRKEAFGVVDVIRLLLNSFIYFAIGYAIISDIDKGSWLGLFTLGNAVVHFVFSYIVYTNQQVDRKLFYLLMAMVLCFLTIAVPVQLEGNWVTLFWSAEILLLFWIGRMKEVRFYEYLAMAMIFPALISLGDDWADAYGRGYYNKEHWLTFRSFFNITFLTTLITSGALAGWLMIDRKKPLTAGQTGNAALYNIVRVVIPVLLLIVLYAGIRNEVAGYWQARYYLSEVLEKSSAYAPDESYTYPVYDSAMRTLGHVWTMNYTLGFFIVCCLLALYRWKQEAIAWCAWGSGVFVLLIFLMAGLMSLSDLRDDYLSAYNANYFTHSSFLVNIRYVSFAFFGVLLWLTYRLGRSETLGKYGFASAYASSFVHLFILIVLSNELVHLVHTAHFGSEDLYLHMRAVYKFGFSILWGLYSFALIIYGILKKQKVKRITGIVVFGITLIKLFSYDISNQSTGYKVIAYVILGILLLVVSFLYQKFKNLLFGDENKPEEKS